MFREGRKLVIFDIIEKELETRGYQATISPEEIRTLLGNITVYRENIKCKYKMAHMLFCGGILTV